MTNYIYTSKKTGVAYILEGSHIIEGKTRYTLFSEEEQDRISVTESVLKRWYKKSVEVDFTTAEEKPEMMPMPGSDKLADLKEEYSKGEAPKTKKSKKQSKPRAKTYEEQKWGLKHFRVTSESFAKLFELSEVEYDAETDTINLKSGEDTVARRRAWKNELTGCVWFRFQNCEYEMTDISFDAEADVA